MERKLVSLKVSPWSERAKWALDHHGLSYAVVEHFPIVGERRLRRLVGPGKPRVTVPVLVAGGEVLSESIDIARYAERHGRGAPLFPVEHEAAIAEWVALADETMQSGRALVLASLVATPAALDETTARLAPRWLRPLAGPALRPVARGITRRMAAKYGLRLDHLEPHRAKVRSTLDALRKALGGGSTHLLGSFTYADIVMATVLQGISPVADRYVALGPASRAAWTRSELASEYADLVAWRDSLYERRRGQRAA